MATKITQNNTASMVFVSNDETRFLMAFRRLGMVPVEQALPTLNDDNDIVQESDEVLVRQFKDDREWFDVAKLYKIAHPDNENDAPEWVACDREANLLYHVTHWAPLSIFMVE